MSGIGRSENFNVSKYQAEQALHKSREGEARKNIAETSRIGSQFNRNQGEVFVTANGKRDVGEDLGRVEAFKTTALNQDTVSTGSVRAKAVLKHGLMASLLRLNA